MTAMATSGRAVVFAGSTVVLSLLGLFLLGLPFIYGAALGAIIAVLLVMAASVTLLPAALGFAGAGIDRLQVGRRRPRSRARFRGGFWWRVEPAGAAPPLAGRRRGGRRARWCWRCRSPRCGWPSPTPAPARPPTPRARPMTCSRKGFGPGTNGPLVVALPLPGRRGQATGDLAAHRPGPPAGRGVRQSAAVQPGPERGGADRDPADLPAGRAHLRAGPRTSGTRSSPRATAGTGVTALIGGQTAASIDTAGLISARLAGRGGVRHRAVGAAADGGVPLGRDPAGQRRC